MGKIDRVAANDDAVSQIAIFRVNRCSARIAIAGSITRLHYRVGIAEEGNHRNLIDIHHVHRDLCCIGQAAIARLGGNHQLRIGFAIKIIHVVNDYLMALNAEGIVAIAIGVDIGGDRICERVAIGVGGRERADHGAICTAFDNTHRLVRKDRRVIYASKGNPHGIGAERAIVARTGGRRLGEDLDANRSVIDLHLRDENLEINARCGIVVCRCILLVDRVAADEFVAIINFVRNRSVAWERHYFSFALPGGGNLIKSCSDVIYLELEVTGAVGSCA